jgi:hypothetical protein
VTAATGPAALVGLIAADELVLRARGREAYASPERAWCEIRAFTAAIAAALLFATQQVVA